VRPRRDVDAADWRSLRRRSDPGHRPRTAGRAKAGTAGSPRTQRVASPRMAAHDSGPIPQDSARRRLRRHLARRTPGASRTWPWRHARSDLAPSRRPRAGVNRSLPATGPSLSVCRTSCNVRSRPRRHRDSSVSLVPPSGGSSEDCGPRPPCREGTDWPGAGGFGDTAGQPGGLSGRSPAGETSRGVSGGRHGPADGCTGGLAESCSGGGPSAELVLHRTPACVTPEPEPADAKSDPRPTPVGENPSLRSRRSR